jgi:glutaminyl-tRNA synthetase
MLDAEPEHPYQFEREGYFCADSRYSSRQHPVFNRTVGLRDTWTKSAL